MKRLSIGFLTAAASGLALAETAVAADMPLKAPPPAQLAYRWSGLYAGGHIGGAWAGNETWTTSNELSPAVLFSPGSFGNQGDGSFIGGVQIGYNWQFHSNWVVGLEADWTKTSQHDKAGGPLPGTGVFPSGTYSTDLRRDTKWLASVRGRIGYATDTMLAYFTGGIAWGDLDYSANAFNTVVPGFLSHPTSFGETATGYVLGGGIEYALDRNWSVRGEYLYYRLNGATRIAGEAPPPAFGSSAVYGWDDAISHVARFGINYRFVP